MGRVRRQELNSVPDERQLNLSRSFDGQLAACKEMDVNWKTKPTT